MRLLHTTRLAFEEFFDHEIPNYAILSHRWGPVDQEVSHNDFMSSAKESASGYAKIIHFCRVASRYELDYCWVDTCCIDKTSSAELTEALNAMFLWYERAALCCVYLQDVDAGPSIAESDWFRRGWTLQELIAPMNVRFFDNQWRQIGTKLGLRREIARISLIDEALLAHEAGLGDYSIAQRMSWAARRSTSRLEDEAYCLLGLFGVNMPLLYGEGPDAFRRLQEHILSTEEDNSLLAWGQEATSTLGHIEYTTILALSPRDFMDCGSILKGFATQRILFEVTNRGIMVLIHRSYDQETLDQLLSQAPESLKMVNRAHPLGLTIPLSCYHTAEKIDPPNRAIHEACFLQLAYLGGKWHRVGVARDHDKYSMLHYRGAHYCAYANDYVRIYVSYDRADQHVLQHGPTHYPGGEFIQSVRYLHLRDHYLHLRDQNYQPTPKRRASKQPS